MKHFLAILSIIAVYGCTECPAELPHFTPKHHYPMGWKSSPHGLRTTPFKFSLNFKSVTVASKTHLTDGIVSPYDQLQLGSCVGNAGSGGFEFAWWKSHGSFAGVSRLGLYQDLLRHDGNFPNDSGSTTATLVWVLTNGGVGLESCWPYDPSQLAAQYPACYIPAATVHKVIQSYEVDNTDGVSIRIALSNGYPVVYGGYVYEALENLTSTDYFLPMPSGDPIGGHEELIVGHDDNLVHTYADGTTITGFYEIQNSWGASFANGGRYYAPKAYIEGGQWNEDFAVFQATTATTKTR